jgi:hypothetical protein
MLIFLAIFWGEMKDIFSLFVKFSTQFNLFGLRYDNSNSEPFLRDNPSISMCFKVQVIEFGWLN